MNNYFDDNASVDKKYQKNMDWIVWTYEYHIRSELGMPVHDRDVFLEADCLIDRRTNEKIDNSNKIKNSEEILYALINGKDLYFYTLLSDKGIKKTRFEDGIFTPVISGNLLWENLGSFFINANKTLSEASTRIEQLREEYKEKKKFCVASINFDNSLEKLQSQLECLWLRAHGKETEAQIVNLSRVLGFNSRSINKRSNIKRAVGLWLWDYMNNSTDNVSISNAVSELSSNYPNIDCHLTNDTDYYFCLRCTQACICEKQVLPFSQSTAKLIPEKIRTHKT